jgi:molybdopterin biosynthesis enzyme MoaB
LGLSRSELLEQAARGVVAISDTDLTEEDKENLGKALSELIACCQEELAGQAEFARRDVNSDRTQQLQQQIEVWQALLEKFAGRE